MSSTTSPTRWRGAGTTAHADLSGPAEERRVVMPDRLRVTHLRRRHALTDSTARLIASLAYGEPRQ